MGTVMDLVIVEDATTIVLAEIADEEALILTDETVSVVVESDAGPQGATGPQGPPGPAGASAASYTHVQAAPADVWTVVHGLGSYPGGIVVIDSGGRLVEGDITYVDADTLTLAFSTAFAGTARIS